MHAVIGACKLFETRCMKTTSKRHSFEEMKQFIYAFAAAVVPAGKPVFYVNATSLKNRFFFRVKDTSNNFYSVSYNRWYDDIGSFGKVDSLFKEANPRIMLREQIVSLEELVSEFHLNERKLVNAVFSRINRAVSDAIKCNYPGTASTMRFTVLFDTVVDRLINKQLHECKKYNGCKTPEVSSIDELMVWADLKAGVH